MSETEISTTWAHIARQTQAKINAAWWLDRFTPLLVVLSVISAGGVLYLRSIENTPSLPILSAIFTTALILLGLGAWLTTRHSYICRQDALVRLEDQLHLHNALTTADQGIGKWPAPPTQNLNAGLDWHWPRILTPFAISITLVLAAFLVPVTVIQGTAMPPPSQPLAWEQMEDWLQTLEETDLIEEQSLDDVQEKIEALREQPKDEWFSHSSMEASDSMRDGLNKQIEQLGTDLAHAERGLNAFQNFSEQMNETTKNQLLQEYEQALKNLASSALPPNSKLMQALKNIDPAMLKNISQLSKEQMDALRKQLKKGAMAARKASMGKSGLPELKEGDLIAYLLSQNGKGKGPGRGGISRGPGEAPISLGDPQHLGTNNFEAVQNPDLSRAAPGDLVGVGQSEHDIDKNKQGPQQAGAVKSTGQGGDTIWQESLLPVEKELLKRYFKSP